MDMLLTELVLWGGLLFIFWAMRDTLGKFESDIAVKKAAEGNAPSGPNFALEYATPEEASEIIGHYRDAAIYRYVIIACQRYVFDHIQLADQTGFLPENKRCIAPGLIYVRCDSVIANAA